MPRRSKPLVWSGTSSCFSDLRWSSNSGNGGAVFATFKDGSQYVYPMSRAEARDWFEDQSVGQTFNESIR
jgi:hypothetical protein